MTAACSQSTAAMAMFGARVVRRNAPSDRKTQVAQIFVQTPFYAEFDETKSGVVSEPLEASCGKLIELLSRAAPEFVRSLSRSMKAVMLRLGQRVVASA